MKGRGDAAAFSVAGDLRTHDAELEKQVLRRRAPHDDNPTKSEGAGTHRIPALCDLPESFVN